MVIDFDSAPDQQNNQQNVPGGEDAFEYQRHAHLILDKTLQEEEEPEDLKYQKEDWAKGLQALEKVRAKVGTLSSGSACAWVLTSR